MAGNSPVLWLLLLVAATAASSDGDPMERIRHWWAEMSQQRPVKCKSAKVIDCKNYH